MTAESILKRTCAARGSKKQHPDPEQPSLSRSARCRVCLIRENEHLPRVLINSPEKVCALVRDELVASDREIMLSILLSTDLHLIGIETVAIGGINVCGAHVSEIFRSAILSNAAAIVLAHNHPSGSLEASAEDVAFTRRVVRCGHLLGISITDHLIVSYRGFVSMKEKGLLTETEKPF